MDLIVYGGGSTSCYSPPLVNEGDGALEVVSPYFKLPIGRSTPELFSTLNTFAPYEIRYLCSGVYL